MNFSFSEDQRLLADGVRDFLAGECPPEAVAEAWEQGPSDSRWKAIAGLGVVGLMALESHGGMGMDEVDLVLLLEQAGRVALPEPLAEVAAVTVPLLRDIGGARAAALLADVVTGERLVIPVLQAEPLPAHVATADSLLVQRGSEVHVVAVSDARVTDRPNVDRARPTASVEADLSDATLLADDADDALVLAAARGAWAAAATLTGTGRRVLDLATQYALEREQFGRPIGSFQAVKHQLAQALVAVEFARPLVHRAACSFASGHADAVLHAAMAKAVAGEAAGEAAKAALQVHGAIGYTWEHPLHLFMKRIWSLQSSWGTSESHWQHIEGALI